MPAGGAFIRWRQCGGSNYSRREWPAHKYGHQWFINKQSMNEAKNTPGRLMKPHNLEKCHCMAEVICYIWQRSSVIY